MKRIFKYLIKVDDVNLVEMPVDAEILCVQMQYGIPCIWAMVDDAVAMVKVRTILTFGTGHPVPSSYQLHYVGTYQKADGNLAFHVFEKLQ